MLAFFTIVPLGKGESISGYVTKVAEAVDRSGLEYKLTSMGTVVEGDWDEVMALIKRCHGVMAKYADRVMTTVTVDDRKRAKNRLKGKVDSVLEKTKRKIKV